MVTEFTCMLTVQNTKVNGKMTYKKDMVLKPGKMDQNSKEIIPREGKKVKVCSNGLTTANILEIGLITNYKAREHTVKSYI